MGIAAVAVVDAQEDGLYDLLAVFEQLSCIYPLPQLELLDESHC